MSYIIIGTAGHVDHGKTELIKALTGIDTDRLVEEKERGISIELGFAFLKLPSGEKAGIVDVPGHERFIKNMLAGVGGIDLALVVIAADEGIMPQTREHIDILSILGIKAAVVAITKTDLVDREWLDMISEEVNEFLKETPLRDAPVCFVSAKTREGLSDLTACLDKEAEKLQVDKSFGPARLPVDRVFIVAGFGTVVTGTLVSGQLKVGDNVEINPGKMMSRIRSLQVHGVNKDKVKAPSRVAINLSNIDVEQVKRGFVVALPGAFSGTRVMDVKIRLLSRTEKPVKNRARVRVHIGTAEVIGRMVLLDRNELRPGEEAYAQLLFEKEIVGAKGDKFVIRSYSPAHTIGGGSIINPHAAKHKRYKDEIIKSLSILEKGDPEEIISLELGRIDRIVSLEQLSEQTGLNKNKIRDALEFLSRKGKVKIINVDNKEYFVHNSVYKKWLSKILDALQKFQKEFPLRDGISKEELRSRFFPSYNVKVYQELLKKWEEDGSIDVDQDTVKIVNYKASLSPQQQKIIDEINNLIYEGEFQPLSWKSIIQKLNINHDQEYLQFLLRRGDLVKVSEDIYFHKTNLEKAKKSLINFLQENHKISVGETRDLLNTSRKYALPLLEYFDKTGLTKRIEDIRVLK